MAIPDNLVDKRIQNYIAGGTSSDIPLNRNQFFGETAGGLKLPIKVVNDGSGLGKLVTSLE